MQIEEVEVGQVLIRYQQVVDCVGGDRVYRDPCTCEVISKCSAVILVQDTATGKKLWVPPDQLERKEKE